MSELVLDSTWSYRFRYSVYYRGHDRPGNYFAAEMKRYSDSEIKAEYKMRMDEIRQALIQSVPLLTIGSQVYRSSEIQAVILSLDLVNELNRSKFVREQQTDYAQILMDVLAEWYNTQACDETI